MDNFIVIAFMKQGFVVKAVGLSFEAAHDLREELVGTGLYTAVLVGATGAYFSSRDERDL